MIVVPFKYTHLENLKLQDAQAYLSGWVTKEQGEALEKFPSYTAFIDGTPIVCAGIIKQWHGRAMAWSFISDVGTNNFMSVHRAVKRFLDGCYIQRIEMTVDRDFEPGHRWARALGFTMEAECMRAYSPGGGDCSLYARVL